MNMKHFIIIISCALIVSCAGQRAPEGGPLDTVPPTIISSYPAPNTINFSDNRIIIEFSEYVDRRSVEEAIFVSPAISDVEFEWSGREVEMIFNEALKKNTTYVITIGTDVRDVNNQNRMADAFTLAFSTGASIDKGMIAGKVFDEKPDGVMIFAYRLNDLKIDTLNPTTLKPDYITQTGKSGLYTLPYLSFGNYRVYAVRDEFRNLLYDPETDDAGTATADIVVTEKDTLRTDVQFTLAKEDTTAPRLLSAESPDYNHIFIKFSEQIDTTKISAHNFAVEDTLSLQQLKIKDFFFPEAQNNSIALVTDSLQQEKGYRIIVDSVRDMSGLNINPLARSKKFTTKGVRDTLPPQLSFVSIQDTTKKYFTDFELRFEFNDALQRQLIEKIFLLRQKDSVKIPATVRMNSSASVTLLPTTPLKPNSGYFIVLNFSTIKDLQGNGYKDSVRSFPFYTIDNEELSSIEGMVAAVKNIDKETYRVAAKNISDKRQKTAQVVVSASGKFLLSQLPKGEYTLNVF